MAPCANKEKHSQEQQKTRKLEDSGGGLLLAEEGHNLEQNRFVACLLASHPSNMLVYLGNRSA